MDLSAYLAFPEPVEVEEVATTLNRKEIGSTFKKDSKLICEAIEAMTDQEKMAFEVRRERERERERERRGGRSSE